MKMEGGQTDRMNNEGTGLHVSIEICLLIKKRVKIVNSWNKIYLTLAGD